MSGEMSAGVRTSDAEREQVARVLRAAVGEGMLTLEEGDERLAATYAARYRHELARLTADLPGEGRPLIADELRAEAWAAGRAGLVRHAAFVVVIGAALVTAWAVSGALFFWPLFPILFLTFGLMRHARFVRSGYPWGWGRGPWGPNRRVWSR